MTTDSLETREGRGAKVGFICVRELAERTFRAGLLVTDSVGKPLEFRSTNVLCPDTVQGILYGGSLLATVARDLCGPPLIESIRDRPDILVADREEFLLLHTPQLPLTYVRRSGETLEIDTGGEPNLAEEELPSTRFQPMIVRFAPGVPEEERQAVRAALRGISGNIDLLEPFERISRALEVVHRQEGSKGD